MKQRVALAATATRLRAVLSTRIVFQTHTERTSKPEHDVSLCAPPEIGLSDGRHVFALRFIHRALKFGL